VRRLCGGRRFQPVSMSIWRPNPGLTVPSSDYRSRGASPPMETLGPIAPYSGGSAHHSMLSDVDADAPEPPGTRALAPGRLRRAWCRFGTEGSEVQILSPRPISGFSFENPHGIVWLGTRVVCPNPVLGTEWPVLQTPAVYRIVRNFSRPSLAAGSARPLVGAKCYPRRYPQRLIRRRFTSGRHFG
jgi:hypothetical protein